MNNVSGGAAAFADPFSGDWNFRMPVKYKSLSPADRIATQLYGKT
jgi:hypothetical protein